MPWNQAQQYQPAQLYQTHAGYPWICNVSSAYTVTFERAIIWLVIGEHEKKCTPKNRSLRHTSTKRYVMDDWHSKTTWILCFRNNGDMTRKNTIHSVYATSKPYRAYHILPKALDITRAADCLFTNIHKTIYMLKMLRQSEDQRWTDLPKPILLIRKVCSIFRFNKLLFIKVSTFLDTIGSKTDRSIVTWIWRFTTV